VGEGGQIILIVYAFCRLSKFKARRGWGIVVSHGWRAKLLNQFETSALIHRIGIKASIWVRYYKLGSKTRVIWLGLVQAPFPASQFILDAQTLHPQNIQL